MQSEKMKMILAPLLAMSMFTTACEERSANSSTKLEERHQHIPEVGTMLSSHPELHHFPGSSKIWIDKELTSLEESNIKSRRLGYSLRTKHPEIQEKVKGVFAHSSDRIMPFKKDIELNEVQKNHPLEENISHILKRINSVYKSLNYPAIDPKDIEAWWQDTDWKEKEGLPYDHYYINALILKNGHTLFIFDRRPVLTEDEIRYW